MIYISTQDFRSMSQPYMGRGCPGIIRETGYVYVGLLTGSDRKGFI